MASKLASGRARRRAWVGFDRAHDERSGSRDMGGRARSPHQHRRKCSQHSVRLAGVLRSHEERGSAAIESVVSIVLLVFMFLAVVEVAFTLYARNVIAASAHEGARAAVERGRSVAEAEAIAVETVRRSAGGLINGLRVDVGVSAAGDRSIVSVTVGGVLEPFGPVPLPMNLRTDAHAVAETEIP
jgi:hypothetical protein